MGKINIFSAKYKLDLEGTELKDVFNVVSRFHADVHIYLLMDMFMLDNRIMYKNSFTSLLLMISLV